MKKGNLNATFKSLTNCMKDRMLPLNYETLNNLKEKHMGNQKMPTMSFYW